MAQAVDAWWFGWEAMVSTSLHVYESAATAAAGQMAIARSLTETLGPVAVAPIVADTARIAIPDVGRVEQPPSTEPPL